MQPTTTIPDNLAEDNEILCNTENSAVAWQAIIAGAVAAAAVSLILLILGSGLGLASVSPWSHAGISATAFTASAAIWLIVMQWTASGLGGYLAGRLRHKWVNTHEDEVFFRDTAHGFLAWALATVITAAFLASAASSVVGGVASNATTLAAGAAAGVKPGPAGAKPAGRDPLGYFVDGMLRTEPNSLNKASPDKEAHIKATHILVNGTENGHLSEADKAYLSRLVAAHSNVSAKEASARVDTALMQMDKAAVKAREEADKARKTASTIAIFTFLSMVIGAFIASVAAALGGRHRDTCHRVMKSRYSNI